MRRKLLLPALAACLVLVVSAPVATAKPAKAQPRAGKRLSKARGAIKGIQKALSQMDDSGRR